MGGFYLIWGLLLLLPVFCIYNWQDGILWGNIRLVELGERCAHTYTNRQALHKQPISSTRQIWAEWTKKTKKKKRRWGLWEWLCEAETIRTEKEREKPGLLNLKQCWGNEDGFLFIATDFLFKRALLLCFLSRLCCLSLTSSLFFHFSPHTVIHKYRVKTQKYAGVNLYIFFSNQRIFLFFYT